MTEHNEPSKGATLDELSAAADACHKSCSDYSCVRMGSCTGVAGHNYSDAIRARDTQRKQDNDDARLAPQINRLKKAGAI
jgi:hypothetical protein